MRRNRTMRTAKVKKHSRMQHSRRCNREERCLASAIVCLRSVQKNLKSLIFRIAFRRNMTAIPVILGTAPVSYGAEAASALGAPIFAAGRPWGRRHGAG
jgi:hypothetical protein